MKSIIILFTSMAFIFPTEYKISGIYVADGGGYYFRIDEEHYQYLSIAADNSYVLCKGNIMIKNDTLFFDNDFSLRGAHIFCDSLEFGIIQSNESFSFRNEVYKKRIDQDNSNKKKCRNKVQTNK